MTLASVEPTPPTHLNLDVTRGLDHELTFVLTDSAGRPVDISQDTVAFSARETWTGDLKVPPVVNEPGQHDHPAAGKTTFELSKTAFHAASASSITTWLYEVRRTLPSGRQVVHATGELRIRPALSEG